MRAVVVAAVLLAGCSASERIAVEANGIADSALAIERRATRIGERSTDADTVADAAAIIQDAAAIRSGVATIHSNLPGVVDRVPAWMTMLKWLAIAIAGVAVAWMLTASGALSAMRVALGWLPRRAANEAEMAASTLATDRPETMREWIAMKRSTDREFDAAWKRMAVRSRSPNTPGEMPT